MSNLIPVTSERALLGCIMDEGQTILPIIADLIEDDSFGVDAHRIVHGAFKWLLANSKPIDIVSVTQRLMDTNTLDSVGGGLFIANIGDSVASSANFRHYAEIVRMAALRRQSLAKLTGLAKRTESGDDSPEAMINQIEELAEKTRKALNPTVEIISARDAATAFINELLEMKKAGSIPGITSGFAELDGVTGGLRPGDLWVVGALPSRGKSVLGIQFLSAALDDGKTCAMFSMELPAEQIIARLISHRARVDYSFLRNPSTITQDVMNKIKRETSNLASMPLFIIDKGRQTSAQILANCQMIKDRHGLGLVNIDYVQLVRGEARGKENRVEELSIITKDFKAMAKDLKCGVITQSQLNDDGKLKGARSIGEDADLVCTIRENGIWMDKVRNGKRDWLLNATLDGAKQRFY